MKRVLRGGETERLGDKGDRVLLTLYSFAQLNFHTTANAN